MRVKHGNTSPEQPDGWAMTILSGAVALIAVVAWSVVLVLLAQ